ncbi:hypothetical protein [Cohnella soli]|uniref:DUF4179 domain-containing protein n=1 Tax=Cohnella soli TaxID=425005 RepID=A0ABW0I239_9BACL
MKIRISEMFDDASMNTDSIEIKMNSDIDKEKVRQMVLNKINSQIIGLRKPPVRTKKITRRIALIFAVIILMSIFAFGANAATGGKLFGAITLNEENRHLARQTNYAYMEEAPSGTKTEAYEKRLLISNIIHENQLQSINADSVTNIAVEKDDELFSIPEILTDNGDLVIFTKMDQSGWHLDKGEKLSIRFNLDLTTNQYSDPKGENMEIGFIRNGELIQAYFEKDKEFSYTITADEAGEYYFYTENYSAGKIVIEKGMIE